MVKKLNTAINFTFCDGTSEKMTLTYYALYQLKSKDKVLYDRYNKIMTKGASDELEMITVLYTAYRCANLDAGDKPLMTEEEFLMKCGSDRKAVGEAITKLIRPKN